MYKCPLTSAALKFQLRESIILPLVITQGVLRCGFFLRFGAVRFGAV